MSLTVKGNGPITIKTSKEWVLPPRPKPGRKQSEAPKDRKKKIAMKAPKTSDMMGNCSLDRNNNSVNVPKTPSGTQTSGNWNCLKNSTIRPKSGTIKKNIEVIDNENNQLKAHLLSLIHDYKSLKSMVLNKPSTSVALEYDGTSGARKRAFTELNDSLPSSIMQESDQSHTENHQNSVSVSPEADDFLDLINYDRTLDVRGEEDDEFIDSPALSRTTSPSSDMENSLMSSLTRSTTVSTNSSHVEKKNFKFYDLPSYSTNDYNFTFDKVGSSHGPMSVIEEDNYNMVTDFLEEKLMRNDLNYYEQQQQNM